MKKIIPFFVAVLFTVTAIAQTTYRYDFFYNLKESENIAGDLTSQCTASNFGQELLPLGFYRTVYSFDKSCDLVFNDAPTNHLLTGTYTIEIYFKIKDISGYNKLIDYNNLADDAGLYCWNGYFNMYPNFNSTGPVMKANTYQYIAITRDNTTKEMRFYYNNTSVGTLSDFSDTYAYGADKKITFFKDDNNTNTEETSGAVTMIYITNRALDQATITDHYNNLSTSLSINNTPTKPVTRIYPNPTTSYIHITQREGATYSISDVTGRLLQQREITKNDQVVNTSQLPNGVYLLQIIDKRGYREYHTINKE